MSLTLVTATPCAWQHRRAHFTGTPYAECETCRATCHYFESLDELEAGCPQITNNNKPTGDTNP